MKIIEKIIKEIRIILRTTGYFATVFILMMVMKTLDLKDYNIEFAGLGQALIGALIMAKVILLMEMITLGKWVQDQPPIVDILLRTLLYSAGVAIVVLLEKAFEVRHEVQGFWNAILHVFGNRDIYHVWATTIGAAASIFVYNAFSIIQLTMGRRALAKLYFHTPLNQVENLHKRADNA